jgi:hypothetical protein
MSRQWDQAHRMIQNPRAFTGIGILNGAHKITSPASLGDFVRNTHHSRPEVRTFSLYTRR